MSSPYFSSGIVGRTKHERAWKSPRARKARRGRSLQDLFRNQHGRHFVVLEHQYGHHDVMWKRSVCTKREAHLYETFFVLAKTRLTQEQVSFLDGTRLSKVASYFSRQVPFMAEVCILCKKASCWGRVLFFLVQMALIKSFLSRLN